MSQFNEEFKINDSRSCIQIREKKMWKHFSPFRFVKKQSLKQEFIFWFLIRHAIPGSSSEGRKEWAEKEEEHLWRGVLQSWLLLSIKCNGLLHLLRPSSERPYNLLHFSIVHWQVVSRKGDKYICWPFSLGQRFDPWVINFPPSWGVVRASRNRHEVRALCPYEVVYHINYNQKKKERKKQKVVMNSTASCGWEYPDVLSKACLLQ